MLDSYACDLPGQKIDLEQELCVGYVPRKPMVATFQRDPSSSSSSSHGGVGGGFRMVAATATEFYNFIGFKDACQASDMLIKHNSKSKIMSLQLPASFYLYKRQQKERLYSDTLRGSGVDITQN